MPTFIPVFEPEIGNSEVHAVIDALRKGEISGSFGDYIPQFEQEFAAYCGCKYGVAVSNGTTALHLAVTVAGIPKGSEILISSSTNIATALAAAHNGSVPIPVDSEAETWNLNLDLIERLITPKTKAIIPVHLYGHPIDMDRLMQIAKKHNLIVIEDCAESHGATVRGKMTGSFGDMGCFSFYANKVITTGEGGMVVTNNPQLAEKLRLLRNLAFTEPRFRHLELGYNFRMTGMQAALGLIQTRKIEAIVAKKRWVAQMYTQYLEAIPGLQLPVQKDWARNVYWMYAVVVQPNFGIGRDALMHYLNQQQIQTRTFFCPMNDQPCLKTLPGYRQVENPIAKKLWTHGLYLPSSTLLSETQIAHIADMIAQAAGHKIPQTETVLTPRISQVIYQASSHVRN